MQLPTVINMDNNLFFAILIYLKDKDLYTEIDLSPFITSYNSTITNQITTTNQIFPVLKALDNKHLIEYFANKELSSGTWVNAKSDESNLSDLVSLRAKLTIDGFRFINDYLKEQRQDKILTESKSIAKKAMIVSIISAATSFFGFLLDIKKEVLDKKEDTQIIQKQQQVIDSLTQNLKSLTKNSYHLLFDTSFSKISFYIDTAKNKKH